MEERGSDGRSEACDWGLQIPSARSPREKWVYVPLATTPPWGKQPSSSFLGPTNICSHLRTLRKMPERKSPLSDVLHANFLTQDGCAFVDQEGKGMGREIEAAT